MKKFHWATAFATSLLAASPSVFASSYSHDDLLAPEDNATLIDHNPSGSFYGGAAVGYLSSSDRSRGLSCTGGNCDSMVWKGYVGYQATDSIAGELTYHNLGHYEDTLNNSNSDASGYSATANIKTGLQTDLLKDVEIFGRAGLMVWNAPVEYAGVGSSSSSSLDNSGTDLIIGGGADYRLNNNLMIRGEYEHVGGDLNAHIFSVGAKYSTL